MKTIFINYFERSSVPIRSQESYRKSRDSSREPTMNGRESAMTIAITCHNCIRPGHKKKYCNQLNKWTNKSSNVENGKRKWCSYHQTNGHLNKNCYHISRSQQISMIRKNGTRITTVLAIRMMNVFIKKTVNFKTVLLMPDGKNSGKQKKLH